MDNKELNITLNESCKFPVISEDSFMDLLEVSFNAINAVEPKFENIEVDKQNRMATIVMSDGLAAKLYLPDVYKQFVINQKEAASSASVNGDFIETQVDEISSVAAFILHGALDEVAKIKSNPEQVVDTKSTSVKTEDITDYSKIRSKLIAVPVNLDNIDKEKFVCETIFEGFNMGIGFTAKILLAIDDNAISTAMVTKEMVANFGVSKREVLYTALSNSISKYAPKIEDISDKIGYKSVWLSTEENETFGAIAAMYPGVLKTIADDFEDDVILVFGGTSSVLCLPYSGMDTKLLRRISEILSSIVNEVESQSFLTNRPYVYSRERDMMIPISM